MFLKSLVFTATILASQAAFAAGLNLHHARCGNAVGATAAGEVCFAYTRYPDPYQDYLTVAAGGSLHVYKILAEHSLDDARTQVAVTIEKDGSTTVLTAAWRYEAGTYPGDGDDYPLTLAGTTPDGVTFQVTELHEVVD